MRPHHKPLPPILHLPDPLPASAVRARAGDMRLGWRLWSRIYVASGDVRHVPVFVLAVRRLGPYVVYCVDYGREPWHVRHEDAPVWREA